MKSEIISLGFKLKILESSSDLVENCKLRKKNLIKSTKKMQTVLKTEVNVIGTSTEKNLQMFF